MDMTPSKLGDTISLIMDLWPLFTFLGSIIISATMLFLYSRFTSRKDCEAARAALAQKAHELDQLLDAESARLQSLESTLKNLPTGKDLSELALSMERLSGRLATQEAVANGHRDLLKRVEHQLNRVDSYLREND